MAGTFEISSMSSRDVSIRRNGHGFGGSLPKTGIGGVIRSCLGPFAHDSSKSPVDSRGHRYLISHTAAGEGRDV